MGLWNHHFFSLWDVPSFVILYPLSTCPWLFSINSAHRLSTQTWFPDSFIEQLVSSWPWTVQKAWGEKPKTLANMFFTSWWKLTTRSARKAQFTSWTEPCRVFKFAFPGNLRRQPGRALECYLECNLGGLWNATWIYFSRFHTCLSQESYTDPYEQTLSQFQACPHTPT